MWKKRSSHILLGVCSLALVVTLPMLAQDTPDPQPYIDAPATGTWRGVAYFGPEDSQLAASITFEINGNGQATGGIRFEFQYAGMADNLIQLMNAHGCVAAFQIIAADSDPVSGYFIDAERAVGAFSANACFLEGYGDLTFGAPVSGVWYAEHEEQVDVVFGVQPTALPEAEAATTQPPDQPTEAATQLTLEEQTEAPAEAQAETVADGPTDFGIEIFLDNCSECHGYFGEGGPGVADLTAPQVQRMSDEKLLEVINLGVEGTEMEPWGRLLTEEEKQAVIQVIRQPEVLRERYQ